jgi:hypothetical protein
MHAAGAKRVTSSSKAATVLILPLLVIGSPVSDIEHLFFASFTDLQARLSLGSG